MTRLVPYLDRFIDFVLVLLLVFTPLAFGSVEDWAQAAAHFLITLVLAAWVLKVAWGPAPLIMSLGWRGDPEKARLGRSRRPPRAGLFGGRVLLSGIEIPALLFALVVGAQTVPIPQRWLAAISPMTMDIVKNSFPQEEGSGPLTVRRLEDWLLHRPAASASASGSGPTRVSGSAASLLPDAPLLGGARPRARISLSPAATRRQLGIFLGYLAVFLVGINQWRDRRHASRIIVTLAVLGGLVSLFGILQKLTWNGKIYWLRPPSQGGTPFGPFVNQNHFAGYLEMLLPVTVGLMATLAVRARQGADPTVRLLDRGETFIPRLILLAAAGLSAGLAILICRSRGALLSILLAAGLFLLISGSGRGRWKTLLGGLLCAGLAAGLIWRIGGGEAWSRYASLVDPAAEPSFAFRLDTARRTLALARDFPFMGVGLGAFPVIYPLYAPGGRVNRTGAAHNDLAQLAAETGAVGTVLALAGLALFLKRFLLPGLRRAGSAHRHTIHGLAVGFLAMLIHSLFDFNLQIYSNGLLFVVLGALLASDGLSRIPAPAGEPAGPVA